MMMMMYNVHVQCTCSLYIGSSWSNSVSKMLAVSPVNCHCLYYCALYSNEKIKKNKLKKVY